MATLPLDVYIERHRLEAIDLVKIDVELHEMEVLEGFARRIFTMRPVIFIEVLNDDMARKLGQFFDPHNYRYVITSYSIHYTKLYDNVSDSGYVDIPVIGRVQVLHKTMEEARAAIARQAALYLRDATVTVKLIFV